MLPQYCDDALHDWTEIMNQGQGQIDVILLDFSKAFDTVPHQRLLHKLKSYGIRHHTLNWINAFLTNRTHQVLVNGSHSETQIVTSGVPQGTVLGPLLFLLYINDIENNLTSKIRLFADDSALYRKIDTLADSHSLQQDILRLQDWADKWQMKFNIKKCKLLRITKTIIRFKYLMRIHDTSHAVTNRGRPRARTQTTTHGTQCLIQDKISTSPSPTDRRAVVTPRGRDAARSSRRAVVTPRGRHAARSSRRAVVAPHGHHIGRYFYLIILPLLIILLSLKSNFIIL